MRVCGLHRIPLVLIVITGTDISMFDEVLYVLVFAFTRLLPISCRIMWYRVRKLDTWIALCRARPGAGAAGKLANQLRQTQVVNS